MNPEKHKAALTALEDLIADVLGSTNKNKYQRVGRLTRLAVRLASEASTRVGDFKEQHTALIGGGLGDEFADYGEDHLQARAGQILPIGIGDQGNMMREVLSAGLQINASTNKKNLVCELNELELAKDRLISRKGKSKLLSDDDHKQLDVIEKRIKKVLELMEDDDAKPSNPCLVSP